MLNFPNNNHTMRYYSIVGSIGGSIGSLTEIVTWFQTAAVAVDPSSVAQAAANAAVGTLFALIVGLLWKGAKALVKRSWKWLKNKYKYSSFSFRNLFKRKIKGGGVTEEQVLAYIKKQKDNEAFLSRVRDISPEDIE